MGELCCGGNSHEIQLYVWGVVVIMYWKCLQGGEIFQHDGKWRIFQTYWSIRGWKFIGFKIDWQKVGWICWIEKLLAPYMFHNYGEQEKSHRVETSPRYSGKVGEQAFLTEDGYCALMTPRSWPKMVRWEERKV